MCEPSSSVGIANIMRWKLSRDDAHTQCMGLYMQVVFSETRVLHLRWVFVTLEIVERCQIVLGLHRYLKKASRQKPALLHLNQKIRVCYFLVKKYVISYISTSPNSE